MIKLSYMHFDSSITSGFKEYSYSLALFLNFFSSSATTSKSSVRVSCRFLYLPISTSCWRNG